MTNQPTPRLVPDWVEIYDPEIWLRKSGGNLIAVHDAYSGPKLTASMGLRQGELRDLLPALAFFAREGRLPTKEDEQPRGAQGDE